MGPTQESTAIQANPATALFAARPWLILALICGSAMSAVDFRGAIIGGGLATAAAFLDSAWTYITIGRNKILISSDKITFISGKRTIFETPVQPETELIVAPAPSTPLEYISAAYLSFATVRVAQSRLELAVLFKTKRQTDNLSKALAQSLAAVRRPSTP